LGARDVVAARKWQDEYEALPRPITPTLVLPDGYVSRGLGALERLDKLGSTALGSIRNGGPGDEG
jgi:hypothetical protein